MLTCLQEPPSGPNPPRFSVVIPVLNGGSLLVQLLDTLERQQVAGGFEILAVDSGSTDGSLEQLYSRSIRLHAVDPAAFAHGRTRNEALALARGRRLVLLSQDAVPERTDFLEQLAEPLDADPNVAGAYGRQLPHADTDPFVRGTLSRWTPPGEDQRQSALTPEAFAALTPPHRIRRCRFDNVASCLRRSVWQRIPLPDVPFGEDAVWAKHVLLGGHDLVYRASATVCHAHRASALQIYRRERLAHTMLAAEFGLSAVPSLPEGMMAWCLGWPGDLGTLLRARTSARHVPVWMARGALRRAAEIAGQYRGGGRR